MPFALLSIVVLNPSIDIFSSLGILVLFGFVKKTGILQIDDVIQLRNQRVERDEAIRRAIASVIIGGQTLALVLTLVGTPVAYSTFDDRDRKKPLRRFLGKLVPALAPFRTAS